MKQGKGKILIVDDAGEVVVLCVNMLQSLGYTVRGASRGDQALELIRQEPFDLVIVDYKMPEMNGFEVFEQARALRPDMKFMLLTGHGTSDVVEDATDMGFDAILLKPFTREQLRGAVEQSFGGRA
ncbi:MAG: response regulator [Candidatus Rokubacteria bacterium]|nr:response regulator [Candidatus Rokubacteria bacterium]